MIQNVSWSDIPSDARDRLLAQYEAGKKVDEVAIRLGMNPETLKRRLREWRGRRQMERHVLRHGAPLPALSERVYNDFMVVDADNAILTSDWEIPYTDLAMLEAVIMTALNKNIRKLFILGDTEAQDQQGLSTWTQTWADRELPDYEEAHGMLNKLLIVMLLVFDEIYIITGNHDERVAKVTSGQTHLGMFIEKFAPRVKFSRYRYMFLRTSRGDIAMYHQSNFSDNGLALARRMYNSEPGIGNIKPKRVVVTHIHHWGCGKSQDGLAGCYSLGCMRDPHKTQYKSITANTMSQWSQGFAVVERGYLKNYEREETDWTEVLGEEFAARARIVQPRTIRPLPIRILE